MGLSRFTVHFLISSDKVSTFFHSISRWEHEMKQFQWWHWTNWIWIQRDCFISRRSMYFWSQKYYFCLLFVIFQNWTSKFIKRFRKKLLRLGNTPRFCFCLRNRNNIWKIWGQTARKMKKKKRSNLSKHFQNI